MSLTPLKLSRKKNHVLLLQLLRVNFRECPRTYLGDVRYAW
jgi:hypothetical protein